jgi:histidyl-tRNA synthetase
MRTNPLRTLDSKNPAVQEVLAKAPTMDRYLGQASADHFGGLKKLLDSQKIGYRLNQKLVRGLDYYNLTVFEWVSDQLGAQGTVCGGGRYDGLFELIGGKPAPAAGFAMGNERLISLLKAGASRTPDAYVAHQGEGTEAYALSIAEELRAAGLRVLLHAGGGSFKSQMRRADASGARFAVILGEDELRAGEATLKNLRSDAAQVKAARERLLPLISKDRNAS